MCQAASDLNVTATDVTDGFLTELVPLLEKNRAPAVEAILEVGRGGRGREGSGVCDDYEEGGRVRLTLVGLFVKGKCDSVVV